VDRGLDREVDIYPDLAAATRAVARQVREVALGAVRDRGRFSWVLAGGRTPEGLYRLLAASYRTRFPWERTEVYFGDERCVSPRDPESNYAMTRAALLSRVPIARSAIHRLRGEIRPSSQAAAEYARLLGRQRPLNDPDVPRFDLVLLGLGPDGHTASLFPNAPSLRERRRSVLAVRRSGQPPWVPRLTMTLPALAASREVIFLVAGPEKAAAVAATLRSSGRGSPSWPASLVRSTGSVRWFLDRTAASLLPNGFPATGHR
jgi:6-phosphogluconolactonase